MEAYYSYSSIKQCTPGLHPKQSVDALSSRSPTERFWYTDFVRFHQKVPVSYVLSTHGRQPNRYQHPIPCIVCKHSTDIRHRHHLHIPNPIQPEWIEWQPPLSSLHTYGRLPIKKVPHNRKRHIPEIPSPDVTPFSAARHSVYKAHRSTRCKQS